MTWKATCAVTERMKFVVEALKKERTFGAICDEFGVSRRIGYKWLDRFKRGGPAALEDRSRAPKRTPRAVDSATVEVLLDARREHPTWGPRKILAWLKRRPTRLELPASSTVGELYKRYGLVKARRRRLRAPPGARPLEEHCAPNDLWCADFKGHFELGNGDRCHPLTITDAHSRFLLRCDALKRPTCLSSKLVFVEAFREYGLPRAIRTDNGQPFASVGAGGLSSLSVWWVKLGITPERIRAGKPQENGKHERMHRTLKAEAISPAARNQQDQQEAFDRFRSVFNVERPHEALAQKPPAEVYAPSCRACPRNVLTPESPDYNADYEVRRPDHCGVIRWNGEKVYVSSTLGGENVGLREVDDGLWLVCFGQVELGYVDDSRLELGLIRPRCIRRPNRRGA